MSQKGYDTVRELLQKADNRNPDRFDMYIYNGSVLQLSPSQNDLTASCVDFFCYALLDLVDKTLSTIHTKVVKRKYDEAMPLLEALTAFNDLESSWPSK
jgi:hypothetical protein